MARVSVKYAGGEVGLKQILTQKYLVMLKAGPKQVRLVIAAFYSGIDGYIL